MPSMTVRHTSLIATTLALLAAAVVAPAADEPKTARVQQANVRQDGALRMIAATPMGVESTDRLVGAAVLDGETILVAGNRDIQHIRGRQGRARGGNGSGFLVWLTITGDKVKLTDTRPVRGQINRLLTGPDGRPYLMTAGRTLHRLSADGRKVLMSLEHDGMQDAGIDADGAVVVLAGGKLHRYGPDGKGPLWTASWKTYGGNRPGGVTVDPKTGTAVVVGYGMTHTGREPWKDPYAVAFDRRGERVWQLWHPNPKRQVAAKHGGNGLMADTTGKFALAGPEGRVYLSLYADGGNSVCTRNPADPDQPIDGDVYRGVYQKGPGHGFKGASSTSVIFRVNAAEGTVEKGTWMCAWLSRARANGLGMSDAAVDEKGNVYVVGGSASGCPTKDPWLGEIPGYKGGGYLAAFDKDFRMRQCGYFQRAGLNAVAAGHGLVVAVGEVKPGTGSAEEDPVWVHHPLAESYAGGERDAYLMVFKDGGR